MRNDLKNRIVVVAKALNKLADENVRVDSTHRLETYEDHLKSVSSRLEKIQADLSDLEVKLGDISEQEATYIENMHMLQTTLNEYKSKNLVDKIPATERNIQGIKEDIQNLNNEESYILAKYSELDQKAEKLGLLKEKLESVILSLRKKAVVAKALNKLAAPSVKDRVKELKNLEGKIINKNITPEEVKRYKYLKDMLLRGGDPNDLSDFKKSIDDLYKKPVTAAESSKTMQDTLRLLEGLLTQVSSGKLSAEQLEVKKKQVEDLTKILLNLNKNLPG